MENKIKQIALRRFIWVVILVLLSLVCVFIGFTSKSKSSTIKKNITVLKDEQNDYQKIDTCISLLYVAENNSRLYTVTSDTTYLYKFRQQLEMISSIIDAIQSENEKRMPLIHEDVNELIAEKKRKNNQFLYLNQLTDSLWVLSAKNIDTSLVELNYHPGIKTVNTIERTKNIDTVRVIQKRKNKKFWRRIADAISNKNDFENQTNINSTASSKVEKSAQGSELAHRNTIKALNDYYKKLLANKQKLNRTEREILALNEAIFAEFQKALSQLKKDEIKEQERYRDRLLTGTMHTIEELDDLSVISMGIVFILTVVILFNIWKLYKNDLALLHYSNQAVTYARMKGVFLATMSHEIRTPLNSIIGFSEQMNSDLMPDSQKDNLNAIRASSRLLLEIVNDVLDFSKLEEGKIDLCHKPFQPAAIMKEMMDMVGVQAQNKQISLSLTINFDKSVILSGDAFRMKQVMMNLLSNAIKFTPEKGKVEFNSTLLEAATGKIVWSFEVKDSGIGISQENQKIIFNDFQQIDREDHVNTIAGTGLGLAICKRIVELAGGSILVESTINVGSTFKVSIPSVLVEPPVSTFTESSAQEISAILEGKNILVVDDNKMNLLLINKIFKKHHLVVTEASNGQEALDLHLKNHFDLIITDIQMPIMNGLEMAKKIKNNSDKSISNVRIVAFTGTSIPEHQQELLDAGIDDSLMKPFVENDLKQLLIRMFGVN
ncbi:response regulator [Siphonobacter sp. SORGH_AS_1065]|uniref:response regulator n=1 Tax=Siphonobacter sp. SORGH_AS_1065 TaxID=3041795 RepID=UPI00277EF9AD|nr:response regulator [Siphonobacter sp. SORGH_AS_1065]MDQ1088796.1 signal transduction histidine kinase/ActR/RegA family two-component response regulator [Siphonobacter sp. SORGH_AS_1065]